LDTHSNPPPNRWDKLVEDARKALPPRDIDVMPTVKTAILEFRNGQPCSSILDELSAIFAFRPAQLLMGLAALVCTLGVQHHLAKLSMMLQLSSTFSILGL